MSTPNTEALEDAALAEMRAWAGRPVLLELDISSALTICGALQLALRHPKFSQRRSASVCRRVVEQIRLAVDTGPRACPALAAVIELGNDPKNDA